MPADPQARPTDLLPLRSGSLERLAARVPVPTYDRASTTAGIVHFGVGGFHRAHQAMYIESLLNSGRAGDWAICGVGVMPADRAMQATMAAQDHLYTLVQKYAGGEYEPQVIGSIVDYLYAPDDAEAVVRRLADDSTRIVSLTITEGGYGIDDATGQFNPEAPGIAEDLEPGAVPRSVFGLVTAALQRRRSSRRAPFTIMSCDNLPGNGALAREAFSNFAELRETGLGAWVHDEVRFPNSMVDRITPMTTDEDRAEVAARFGIMDDWPVVCEPFTQWVLEDSFGRSRPPLDEVGVQLVSDVAPYELMKLRLLNASHQGLCYFGRLCGYTYVHEASQDPLFRRFLHGYMDEEATPSLDPVPGVDLVAYKDELIDRFSNPQIRDTIARLCAESSDRIPKWLLPVVRYQLSVGGPVARSAAIVASWARYAEGVDENGQAIEIVDRRREEVMARAQRQASEPTAFLQSPELFGDLASNERFVEAYLSALRSLHRLGARRTLEALADRTLDRLSSDSLA
jgi:mannitol 2-dehydrogenase